MEKFTYQKVSGKIAIVDNTNPAYMIEQILPPESFMLIGGPAKAGKSYFSICLALSIATGKPFLNFAVAKPLRVLYFNQEIASWSFHQRYQKIAKQLKLTKQHKTLENILMVHRSDVRLENDFCIESIRNEMLLNQIDVVILDPLYYCLGDVDENDNNAMRKVAKNIQKLCVDRKSVILIHHFRKGGKVTDYMNTDAFRGASAIVGAADSIIGVDKSGSCLDVHFEMRHNPSPSPVSFDLASFSFQEYGNMSTIIANIEEIFIQADATTLKVKMLKDKLAERMKINPKTAINKIWSAVEIGYLEKTIDPDDKRGWIVNINTENKTGV